MSVPVGYWVSTILNFIYPLALSAAGVAVTALAARIGGPLGALLASRVVDQALGRALDFAFADVKGAAKGKVLDIPTNNGVLDTAERYVVANAPAVAAKYGPTLRAKLFSRLSAAGAVTPNSTAADHGVVLNHPNP